MTRDVADKVRSSARSSGIADTDPAVDGPSLDDPAVANTLSSDADAASMEAERGIPAAASLSRAPRGVRPGDTLGRYELGPELGEGGMATVFRARDTELRRDVAVKVLFPHLARRTEIVHRFHREARAAAGLEHKNILRIYDVGGAEADDPPYIVMEMIRGRSLLAELEQRGSMLAEVVACIGALLADALAAAHAASIVHRDIKPANVMIASDGRMLLTDFGVARLETEDSLVTKTGALLGTPAYMSPEQASGDTATARSDLYSLGATLYQLATGSLPYTGSPAKVLAQIAEGALVSPVKKRAAVGPELSRVIEQLMRSAPAERTPTAVVAATELRALVAAAGLGEPADELSTYLADPEGFVRDRSPRIVARLVASCEAALATGALPRAMALADRASALAPTDPAVVRLIEKVAAGGRTHRRTRGLVVVALGLAVVGGGGAAAVALLGGGPAVTPASDAAVLALPDAAPLLPDAAPPTLDAGPVDAAVEVVVRVDAAVPGRRDAGVGSRDAALAVPAIVLDAAPVDAAVPAVPLDAPPARGVIVIKNDTWCEVTIDGAPAGRTSGVAPLRVPVDPGPHTVVCAQPGRDSWTRAVEVVAGATVTAAGTLIETVEVTIATPRDVVIDGTTYRPGQVARLKRGRYRVEAGGVSTHTSFAASCRLQADLACYR